jgi:hypothetical protein
MIGEGTVTTLLAARDWKIRRRAIARESQPPQLIAFAVQGERPYMICS